MAQSTTTEPGFDRVAVAEVLRDLAAPPLIRAIHERTDRVPLGARSAVAARLCGDVSAVCELQDGAVVNELTWAQLDNQTSKAAYELQRRGVTQGSLVGIRLENGIGHIVLTHAAWRLGATVVPTSPRSSRVQGGSDAAGPANVSVEVDQYTTMDLSNGPRPPSPTWGLPDPYGILASGGSTRKPRLVEQRGTLWARFDGVPDDLRQRYGVRLSQTQLVCAPLDHGFGFGYAHALGLAYGHRLVIMRRFSAESALQAIDEQQINYLPVVPTMMRRMASRERFATVNLTSLETVLHAAGVCPPDLKRRWMDRLGAHRVYEAYGATDISLVCSIRGDEWLKHPGSVGRPIDAEILITDKNGASLAPGRVGEIWVRPRPGTRHPVVRGGSSLDLDEFRSTSDRGHVDHEGYLFVHGRLDGTANIGGNLIDSEEIERTILAHGAVRDAAVLSVPDDDLGDRLIALVNFIPDESNGPENIRAWLNTVSPLADHWVSVRAVHDVPRTDAAKLDWSRLHHVVTGWSESTDKDAILNAIRKKRE